MTKKELKNLLEFSYTHELLKAIRRVKKLRKELQKKGGVR